MNGALIGRVRGIEIRLSWSVAIVGWLIAWSLASEVLPEMAEGRSDTEYWVAGVIATVGFFAALVAHELGHSLVAQSRGVGVKSITLWVLGGVARLEKQPEEPRDAMHIAAAGPAVSLVVGAVGLVAGLLTSGLVGATLLWFGAINLVLAVFNLLPAFPLDGGRVYQAWLWKRGMSQEDATAKAARLGGAIGQAMVWIGVLEVLLGALLGGLWMMAIGWFIREASVAEVRGVRTESMLSHYKAADVMTADPECVPADRTLERFVDDVLESGRHAAYPVVDGAGRVVGLTEVKAVRNRDRSEWAATNVDAIMTPLADLAVAAPSDSVTELVRRIEAHGGSRALVMSGSDLVGIVAPSDIVRLTTVAELTLGDAGAVSGASRS